VRYADDCNVYVQSERAGERVMAALRKLYGHLRVQANAAKSAVARVLDRKCRVAKPALETMKDRVVAQAVQETALTAH